ncbi:MAG: B12-binding domain-containing radical SAM protein [Desulfobacterales bacterium]|nr:B12-binding domain-containing radical SAM protein [Desulfobacterales bacterium]
MKIALIAPPYPLEEAPSPPLGLTYIAAVCEAQGHDTVIFDYIVRGYSDEKLAAEINAFGPDVVGTNSVTMNHKQAARMLSLAKDAAPSAITLMGGPHVSFDAENTLRDYPDIDIIVKGEGEVTLAELLSYIEEPGKWSDIKGIVFRSGNGIVETEPRPLIPDLDTLPMPARHLLPMARYQALGFPVSIITSRGCPNQCIFCLGRRMVGQKVRFRSIPSVVDEIQDLVDSGNPFINIADDLFTANRKRVLAFCDEILKRGLTFSWSVFARVNTVDADLLKQMKAAGCHAVSFGVESGNPEMLKRVRKGITPAQVRRASEACTEAGIRGHASFIVGLPGETRDTLADSLKLQKEIDIESAYHFLSPFPGTDVRENMDAYDLNILTHDWDRYDANRAIVSTNALTPEEMNDFVDGFNADIETEWASAKERYNQQTASEEETMQVGGFFRMEMIFALLNRDILESHNSFEGPQDNALAALSRKVADITGLTPEFAESNLRDLWRKGFIRAVLSGDRTFFSWAHHII